ncbi:MAG: hypothetical protein D6788_02025, partial [Planctomycetota bacterium]
MRTITNHKPITTPAGPYRKRRRPITLHVGILTASLLLAGCPQPPPPDGSDVNANTNGSDSTGGGNGSNAGNGANDNSTDTGGGSLNVCGKTPTFPFDLQAAADTATLSGDGTPASLGTTAAEALASTLWT